MRIQGMPFPEFETPNDPRLKARGPKLVSNSDSPPAITLGSWLVPGSTGQVKAMASAAGTALGVVTSIMDLQRNYIPGQYLGASPGFDYLVEYIPVGGAVFIMQEDADTTPIADSAAAYYCDLIVGTIFRQSPAQLPLPAAFANIKVDSSSANSSSNGLLCQLLGLAKNNTAIYSATSLASPRLWRVKVIDAVADESL